MDHQYTASPQKSSAPRRVESFVHLRDALADFFEDLDRNVRLGIDELDRLRAENLRDRPRRWAA